MTLFNSITEECVDSSVWQCGCEMLQFYIDLKLGIARYQCREVTKITQAIEVTTVNISTTITQATEVTTVHYNHSSY